MKIKRTEERFVALGAHPYFQENQADWEACRLGEVIEIPDSEYDSIKAAYGNAITIVDEIVKPTKGKAKPVPIVAEEGDN